MEGDGSCPASARVVPVKSVDLSAVRVQLLVQESTRKGGDAPMVVT